MLLPLESKSDGSDGVVVMVFEGEYGLEAKALLRNALTEATSAEKAVLDFSAVTYIDSTALCELLLFARARATAGLALATLVIRDPNMLRLLEITSVGAMFAVTGTLDEALPRDGKRAIVRYASAYADGSGTGGSTLSSPY